MPREITAYSNPLIRRVRNLRDKRHRRQEGLFLAEGLRILAEAEETGVLPLYLFFAADGAGHAIVRRLIAKVEADGGEAIETTRDILEKLSGKANPQTVIGVYAQPDTTLERIDRRHSDIWLVAQAMRDPGNLGTMLRTGDAVGAGGLILIDDCVDPYSVEAVRASMGAIFTQKVVQARWEGFLPWLRAGEGQLVGLALDGSQPYRMLSYAAPTFIMVGNEAQGLPSAYAAACDLRVRIPMLGKADSLNAAISVAVMAYEVLAQRAAPPLRPNGAS